MAAAWRAFDDLSALYAKEKDTGNVAKGIAGRMQSNNPSWGICTLLTTDISGMVPFKSF